MKETVEVLRKLPLFARLGRMRREGAIEQRGPRVRIRSVAALEALVEQG